MALLNLCAGAVELCMHSFLGDLEISTFWHSIAHISNNLWTQSQKEEIFLQRRKSCCPVYQTELYTNRLLVVQFLHKRGMTKLPRKNWFVCLTYICNKQGQPTQLPSIKGEKVEVQKEKEEKKNNCQKKRMIKKKNKTNLNLNVSIIYIYIKY